MISALIPLLQKRLWEVRSMELLLQFPHLRTFVVKQQPPIDAVNAGQRRSHLAGNYTIHRFV